MRCMFEPARRSAAGSVVEIFGEASLTCARQCTGEAAQFGQISMAPICASVGDLSSGGEDVSRSEAARPAKARAHPLLPHPNAPRSARPPRSRKPRALVPLDDAIPSSWLMQIKVGRFVARSDLGSETSASELSCRLGQRPWAPAVQLGSCRECEILARTLGSSS